MKNTIFILIFSVLATSLTCAQQPPEIEWDKTFGGSYWDDANSIIQTTDGGYAVCGYTSSKGAGSYDFWVLKLNQYGKKQWNKTFGGSARDEANSIIQTTDGGYAVCGFTYSKGAGSYDFWVLKLNKYGKKQWDKTFGGSYLDEANSIIQTTDGGYAVCGYTLSKDAGSDDLWVLRLNQYGKKQWGKTFGRSSLDVAYSIIQTTDGGYAVCGYTLSKGAGSADFWVLKLNQYGKKQWDKTFGGSGWDEANSIIQTTDGGYVVCGYTWSKGAGSSDFWVLRLNQFGKKQWDKTFGGSDLDMANSIIQTTDGGYAVCGYTSSKGAGNYDFWVLKLNRYGEKQWDKTFGGSGNDGANSIIQTTEGGYVVCGFTESKGAGGRDFWVLKLKGDIVPKPIASATKEGMKIIPKRDDLPPKPTAPAILVIDDVIFMDANNNRCIDANEKCSISFTIENKGKGEAYDLNAKIETDPQGFKNLAGLNKDIGNLSPGKTKVISIPVNGNMTLKTGQAKFRITVIEANGFDADPVEITIPTLEFQKPELIIADHQFSTAAGKVMLGVPVSVKVAVQNIGQGTAENVKLQFQLPENVFSAGDDNYSIVTLQSNESKLIDFEFFTNKKYSLPNITITAKLTEKYQKFGSTKTMSVNIDEEVSSASMVVVKAVSRQKPKTIQKVSLTADVDKNIPVNTQKYPDRFALIIGNEDYQSRQTGLQSEQNVAFAKNDAQIFARYCENTLGVPSKNITTLTDATAGEMSQNIELISKLISKIPGSELIFYYAGHGFPDENTKIPYLIPVDVNAGNLSSAIKLSEVYKKFGKSGAKRVTLFIDACFSGGGRETGLLAARGVKIAPKEGVLSGNIVIFTASSGEQSALSYKEKQHGMFTYFLLKKLQSTKGDVTYSELDKYISQKVSVESLRINKKEQDPKVNVSSGVVNDWKNWKLR